MSKSTLRKRIALTAVTALFAGMLSVASAPVASANVNAGTTTVVFPNGTPNGSLFVATTANTGGAAVVGISNVV